MLDYNEVLRIADQKYRELKAEKHPYTAPELLPSGIQSDQIRALAHALVVAINQELRRDDGMV
jgi:hypothetical protein